MDRGAPEAAGTSPRKALRHATCRGLSPWEFTDRQRTRYRPPCQWNEEIGMSSINASKHLIYLAH